MNVVPMSVWLIYYIYICINLQDCLVVNKNECFVRPFIYIYIIFCLYSVWLSERRVLAEGVWYNSYKSSRTRYNHMWILLYIYIVYIYAFMCDLVRELISKRGLYHVMFLLRVVLVDVWIYDSTVNCFCFGGVSAHTHTHTHTTHITTTASFCCVLLRTLHPSTYHLWNDYARTQRRLTHKGLCLVRMCGYFEVGLWL